MTLVDDGIVELGRPLAGNFTQSRIPNADDHAALTHRMIVTHRTVCKRLAALPFCGRGW